MKRYIVEIETIEDEKYKIYLSAKSRLDAYNKVFYFINKAYNKKFWLLQIEEE